ncbi:MAG: hypothetical protein H6744_13290 [Deltaproteobacteria bacterium]|nr:hypothetical protein [Deltaproteobacteria bacterium]
MRSVCLSFDQDWAPAWASRDIHAALVEAGVEATFFATHGCESLETMRERGLVELGWHPNFLTGSTHGSTTEEVLDTMALLVPEARGARAHCLVRGTPFLLAYKGRGLIYDAADLHDGVPGLRPFASWTGMVRIPIWFEDDVHLQRGLPCRLEALDLASEGLKVFTFHPVLVALNATSMRDYAALKAELGRRGVPLTEARRKDFAPFQQRDQPGLGDLFRAVVAWLSEHPEARGGQLQHIAEAARGAAPDDVSADEDDLD